MSAPPVATGAPAPPNQDTAVATRDEVGIGSPIIEVRSIAGRNDVERVETIVELPAGFQYVIPGRKKVPGTRDNWVDDNKVGITSDGYDYINRVLGATFFLPDFVPDQKGAMVRNPIHREDGYIYLRLAGLWYNEAGQLVGGSEDIEVDPRWILAAARVESYGAEPVMKDGVPYFDQFGFPVMKLKDADAERKALKAYMQARTMGIRYAQTVARTRLLKQATGIKSLPLQQPRKVNLRVVGFRDAMTPIERQAQAAKQLGAMFGSEVRPEQFGRMSPQEIDELEPVGSEEALEATVTAATLGEPDVENAADRAVDVTDADDPQGLPPAPVQDEFALPAR